MADRMGDRHGQCCFCGRFTVDTRYYLSYTFSTARKASSSLDVLNIIGNRVVCSAAGPNELPSIE